MKRKLVITAAILLVTCGLSACAGSGNAKKTGSSGDVNADTEKKVSKKVSKKDRVLSEAVGAEEKVKSAKGETKFFVKHTRAGTTTTRFHTERKRNTRKNR